MSEIKIIKGKAQKEKPALIITDDLSYNPNKATKIQHGRKLPKPEDFMVKVPNPLHDPVGFDTATNRQGVKVHHVKDVVDMTNQPKKPGQARSLKEALQIAQNFLEKNGASDQVVIALKLHNEQHNPSAAMRAIDQQNKRAHERSRSIGRDFEKAPINQ